MTCAPSLTVSEYLHELPRRSALVVGDVCLDRWCTYEPDASEPSRETGIPRIAVVKTTVTPGAGGTIANNLAALGVGQISLLGIVGDDGSSHELLAALGERRISGELLIRAPGRATFTYTKLINRKTGEEDRPRIDYISQDPLPDDVELEVTRRLLDSAEDFDVIFVSDQAETGQAAVVTPGVRHALETLAEDDPERVLWVDSRQRAHEFRRVILKPNEQEAEAACRALFGRRDYAALREKTRARSLIVTLGERGALVLDDSGERVVANMPPKKPVDVCGAGDSFSAAAGMAFAISGSASEAARFGNFAASITVMKRGTGTATPEEMLAAEATAVS